MADEPTPVPSPSRSDDQPSKATGARKQRTAEQTAGTISTLLAVAIVLLGNYLAFRHYDRLDWTSKGSPRSRRRCCRG